MKVRAPSLAPMLRSDAQGRMLARLLSDPAQEYNLSELVAWSRSSMPTVQREVGRAEAAGVVLTRKVGPARVVRANVDHPLYPALRQVVLGTYGPPAVVAREFSDLAGAQAVVLFGSWAARYLGHPGPAPNDVDVLVIGAPEPDAVDDAADRAEQEVGVPIQVTIRSRDEWEAEREAFIQTVKSRPIVPVLVEDDPELLDELHRLERSAAERQ